MKKNLNYFSFFVMMMAGIIFFTSAPTALAVSSNNISRDISNYNGIIFGDHTIYQADIEGSTAIQGNIHMKGGFSYAASGEGHKNILIGKPSLYPNTPGLLLGGEFIRETNAELIISGGDFVFGPNSLPSKSNISFHNGNFEEIAQTEMNDIFTSFRQQVTHNLFVYQELIAEGTNIGQLAYSSLNLYESKKNSNVLFVNLSGTHFKEANLPNLDNYQRIIFYSPENTFTFSNGALLYNNQMINTNEPQSALMNQLASKITWIFPNATEINLNAYGLIGDVYAPNASFHGRGGAVNGALYAHDLIQEAGFELHNFNNEPLSEIPLTPIEPDEPNVEEPNQPENPDKPTDEEEEEIPLTPLEPSKPVEEKEEEIPLTPLEPSKPVEEEEEEIPLTPLEPSKPVEEEEEEIPLTPLEPSKPVEEEKEEIPLTPLNPSKPEEEKEEKIPLTPLNPSKPEEELPLTPINPGEPVKKEKTDKEKLPFTGNKPGATSPERTGNALLPKTGENDPLAVSMIGLAVVIFLSATFLNRKKNSSQ